MGLRLGTLRRRTKLTALILAAVTTRAFGFAGGTGKANDPYQIATAEQLMAIGSDPNLLDKHFVLVADIDLDPNLPGRRVFTQAVIAPDIDDAWEGFDGTPFTGVLDGAAFAISNLTIRGSEHLGLFGVVGPQGVAKNLWIQDGRISRQKMGCDRIGTVAGENEGRITNCHVTAAISLGELAAWLDTAGGGLVGRNTGELTRCSAHVQMTGCLAQLGGLVGVNAGIVRACHARGQLSCAAGYIGGLIGLNVGVVYSSYAHVSVTDHTSTWNLGGLIGCNLGRNGGTVVNCYSVGTLFNGFIEDSNRGGLVGGFPGSRDGATVVNCFWNTEVSAVYESEGGMGLTTAQMTDPNVYSLNGWGSDPNWVLDPGKDYPRLAWEATPGQTVPQPVIDWLDGSGTEDDPYVVSTAEQLSRIGTASILWDKALILSSEMDLSGIDWRCIGLCPGTDFVGSFDGDGHVVTNLTIDTGDVPERSTIGMFGYIGSDGLIHNLVLKDAVLKCGWGAKRVGILAGVNQGAIVACPTSGSLSACDYSAYLGQIVGYNTGSVKDCYSTASVSAGAGSRHVGGLVGFSEGLVGAYSLATSDGGGPDSEFGLPLTDAQMKQQAAFLGWDFEKTWMICEGRGYPRLQWENVDCAEEKP